MRKFPYAAHLLTPVGWRIQRTAETVEELDETYRLCRAAGHDYSRILVTHTSEAVQAAAEERYQSR